MPKMNFTIRGIEALRPSETTQVDYFDQRITGLGLRVSRTGRKTWFCMYRHGGRLRRYTIGAYPALGLADAREQTQLILRQAALGNDPGTDKKIQRLAETFKELSEAYLEKYAKVHKRSWKEDERIINKDLLPIWRNRKATDIKRRDVIALLDKIMERNAPIQANRALALVRKIFNWAISRDLLENNPCTQVKAPGKEQQRDRVLTREEIKILWNTFENEGLIIGSMFKLRLVTAQRGGEVSLMRWEDIDLKAGWWTVPANNSKNNLAHRVPLSRLALEILNNLYDKSETEQWVFPSPTCKNQPITNVQKAAKRMREKSKVDFVLHDLRRTAASIMTGMGISRLVVSKILNHVESGVTKVYDRHSYDKEKRQALDIWSQELEAILDNKASNVIAFSN